MPFYNIQAEPDTSGLSDADSIAYNDASSSNVQEATMTNLRAYLWTGIIPVTAGATSLVITAATHNGKMIVLNNTAPITITLPQATATGNRYEFFVAVPATGTASKIQVANATDVISGYSLCVTTTSDNAEGFKTSATSDTLSFNGTTQGGVAGDRMTFIDVATGIFSVQMLSAPTSTEATPFSAGVP